MTDDIYNLLESKVTIFGIKGININYSNTDMLKSLDPQLTDEVVKLILERRKIPENGGLFKNEDDFLSFLEQSGVDTETFNEAQIPFLFGPEFNFRIRSTGVYGKATREIVAITYDVDNLKERLIEILDKDYSESTTNDNNEGNNPDQNGNTGQNTQNNSTTANNTNQNKIPVPKGRPRVVYWDER